MDIVERLRGDYSDERLEIAADEIKRLREALEKEQQIDFVLDSRGVAHKDFVIVYKNRAALKGDE